MIFYIFFYSKIVKDFKMNFLYIQLNIYLYKIINYYLNEIIKQLKYFILNYNMTTCII
jgi:hypothetical protein